MGLMPINDILVSKVWHNDFFLLIYPIFPNPGSDNEDAPNTVGASEYFKTIVIAYRTPEEFVCHHQNLLITCFIGAKMWRKSQISKKIFNSFN